MIFFSFTPLLIKVIFQFVWSFLYVLIKASSRVESSCKGKFLLSKLTSYSVQYSDSHSFYRLPKSIQRLTVFSIFAIETIKILRRVILFCRLSTTQKLWPIVLNLQKVQTYPLPTFSTIYTFIYNKLLLVFSVCAIIFLYKEKFLANLNSFVPYAWL